MPTLKQKIAVDRLVENRGNVSLSMREAGYDLTTAKNPKNLTESKGYKQLLKESGLTEELIASALVFDIENKPKNRVSELRLGSEILGMKATEGTGDKTLIINLTGESSKRYGFTTDQSTSTNSIRPA